MMAASISERRRTETFISRTSASNRNILVSMSDPTFRAQPVQNAGLNHRQQTPAFVNYKPLGCDAITLVQRWRLHGPMTEINGVLMFGWSTAVMFEVLRRAVE